MRLGLAGDYNNNGTVDAADYTVWRNLLGTNSLLPNDRTVGSVTREDFNVWKANFGLTDGAGAVVGRPFDAAVPEPSTLALLLFATAIPCVRRGRAALKVPETHQRVTLVNNPPILTLAASLKNSDGDVADARHAA